ncbi:MAG: hypothetical protein OEU86_03535 [Gammaproteobacteria bacterium]|nr:hypothetical protein [Gammaproteobacteria bacterium]
MTPTHRNFPRRAISAVVAVCLLTLAQPAWAYLDPGTGSMIISAIVGLFATVGLALKTYWYKIKSLFRKDSAEPVASEEQPLESDDTAER